MRRGGNALCNIIRACYAGPTVQPSVSWAAATAFAMLVFTTLTDFGMDLQQPRFPALFFGPDGLRSSAGIG